ncbi:MAG: tetratricopeptide repeat protein [candidate division Zixibacteria bacterium]
MKELIINQENQEVASRINDGFALLNLARDWLKQGNPVVAMELLVPAIDSPQASRDKELRAQILKETGRAWMMQSDWDKAAFNYREAQQIFIELENPGGAAQCARNRANMLFQQGNYRESEHLCQTALEWVSEANDYQLRATILNTLGAIQSATGKLQESINTFKLCLADFQSTGNLIRQGYVLLNIGLTQTELGDTLAATDSLNKALALALEEKDLNLVEICYQNIAKCYLENKEYRLAKSVLKTARKILPGLSSKALEAELGVLECKTLRLTGNLTESKKLLEETLQMTIEHKLSALEADVLYEQGLLAKELGNSYEAIAKLDAAINVYRSVGMDKGLHDAVQALDHFKRGLSG